MTKKYVFGLFIVVGGLLSAMHPLSTSAQVAPQIFVSEINWAGSSLSTADEWIKLYNAGPNDVDASGFVLTGAATSGQALSLALGTMIPAGTDLLISNYDLGAKSVLTERPDLVTTALSLPNSGLHIFLSMIDGTVLDEVNFGSTPKFGSTDPFTPAFRDLVTLQWQSVTAETVDESVGADPGIGPIDENPEPTVEVTVEIHQVEANAPSDSPINGGEIEQEPDIEITPEPVVAEPVVEIPVIETPAESAPEPTINEISVAETEIEIVSAIIPPVMDELVEEPITNETVTEILEPIIEPTPIIEIAKVAPVEVIEITTNESESNEELPPIVASEEIETVTVAETPVLKFSPNSIIINEIMSDPSDGVEWIELFNPGTENIDLTNWSITDATDKATILSGVIEAQSYFIVEAPKGRLNNDGDEVNLFDPSGALINAMSYGTADLKSPSKGQSLSLVNNTWTETVPTVAAANQEIITEEIYDQTIPAVDTPTIEQAVLQDVGAEPTENVAHISTTSSTTNRVINLVKPTSTPVKKLTAAKVVATKSLAKSSATKTTTVSGIVTALPGTFGDQIMFIDGIQVYANNKDWPELKIGDVVTVKGTLSTNQGEQRIKIKTASDVKVIGSQISIPVSVTSNQLSNESEGKLVVVEGNVEERDDNRLTLTDENGPMAIIAYSKTGLSWLDLPSTHLKITGIIRHINGETLIYPRDSNDIEFITDDPMILTPITGSIDATTTIGINWLSYLAYALLGGTLSVLAFWFLRSIRNPNTVN